MTQPHSSLAHEQICIRPFRESDLHTVRELFAKSFGGPGSPREIALNVGYTQLPSIMSYICITNSLLLFFGHHHVLGVFFAVGGASLFLAYRSFLSTFFTSYIKRSLNDDLADISKHYKMQPVKNANLNQNAGEQEPIGKSAFWVAEAITSPDGPNVIVGTIALDYRGVENTAELRRLSVLRAHRQRGIGALLIRQLITHARQHGLSSVTLATSIYQPAAMSLYQAFGWKVVSQKFMVAFLLTKVHLVIMSLDLKS